MESELLRHMRVMTLPCAGLLFLGILCNAEIFATLSYTLDERKNEDNQDGWWIGLAGSTLPCSLFIVLN